MSGTAPGKDPIAALGELRAVRRPEIGVLRQAVDEGNDRCVGITPERIADPVPRDVREARCQDCPVSRSFAVAVT